jgi:C-terminal processing protease CtpA/Prc
MTPPPKADNNSVFEALWTTVHDKYALFAFKNIDWNAVRTKYRADALAAKNDEELFAVLGSMLNELQDDHTNLITPFQRSAPSPYYFDSLSFNYALVRFKYLQKTEWVSNPLTHALLERDRAKIGYIRYGSFVQNVSDETINHVLKRFREAGASGFILDIRDNGGGSMANGVRLTSHFVRSTSHAMTEVRKIGPGANEFGTPYKFMIAPISNGEHWTEKPIAILTNRRSYSASSIMAAFMKAPELSHVRLVGDHTGGGGGTPSDFQLPNGWVYRISATKKFIPAGRVPFAIMTEVAPHRNHEADKELGYNFEEGVPVDIPARINPLDREKDAVLERAIAYILTGK